MEGVQAVPVQAEQAAVARGLPNVLRMQASQVQCSDYEWLLRFDPAIGEEAQQEPADDATDAKFHSTYAMAKAAQSALTRAWAAESSNRITIAEVAPPPMPTALRARFHPGEDRAPLCPIDDAAGRLIERLEKGDITSGERVVL